MRVEKFKVYHVSSKDWEIGKCIKTYSEEKNYPDLRKQESENLMEQCRNKYAFDFPSRKKCLFVCKNIEHAEYWRNQKLKLSRSCCYIYELEVTGNLSWHDSYLYDDVHEAVMHKDEMAATTIAKKYWEGVSIESLSDKFQYEGLFEGEAVVKGIV